MAKWKSACLPLWGHVCSGLPVIAAPAPIPTWSQLSIRAALVNHSARGRYWLRLGFTPNDITNGGSDRLVDALVAWGDGDTICERVEEHFGAGADHVCLQVITADRTAMPLVG